MQQKWAIGLPTDEYSTDYQCESPIGILGDWLYFAVPDHSVTRIYVIHKETGDGVYRSPRRIHAPLPHDYIFLSYGDMAILYTEYLFFFRGDTLIKKLPVQDKGQVESHLLYGDTLYLVCNRGRIRTIETVDLKTQEWGQSLDISQSIFYRPGPLSLCGNWITCYGRDHLLFIDPEKLTISHSLRLPRITKLFCPIPLDEDTLLIGYTNGTNAGLLKYSTATKKILWRHKRKFEGPQLKCKFYLHKGKALWVKNERELIAVDVATGEEAYSVPTLPWAYTDLRFEGDRILYGTAGANGYLNCIHSETGEKLWSVYLQNGCAYYDIWQDHAYVGDFSGTIKKISLQDGTIIEEHPAGGAVVGQHKISDGSLYTVLWANDQNPIRLVKISL